MYAALNYQLKIYFGELLYKIIVLSAKCGVQPKTSKCTFSFFGRVLAHVQFMKFQKDDSLVEAFSCNMRSSPNLYFGGIQLQFLYLLLLLQFLINIPLFLVFLSRNLVLCHPLTVFLFIYPLRGSMDLLPNFDTMSNHQRDGQRPTSNNADIVSNLLITTCINIGFYNKWLQY